MDIRKNDPVRYNGEKYRVRSVDIMVTIQDIEGNTLLVNANNIEQGWEGPRKSTAFDPRPEGNVYILPDDTKFGDEE